MILRAIELQDIEQIRKWRNEQIENLRTPFYLTEVMQQSWYENVVSDRNSKYRFYTCIADSLVNSCLGAMQAKINKLIGYCALEISWENRQAELGIVLGEENAGKGYGTQVAELIIKEAFDRLNLDHITFECYEFNKYKNFWLKLIKKYKGKKVIIPKRKFHDGKYWDSIYGCISR